MLGYTLVTRRLYAVGVIAMPENTVLELEIGDGSCPYREFLQSVQRSGDLKALSIIDKIVDNLIQEGLALLNTNMMDNIEDDIYELRAGNYRVFCYYDRRSNLFLLLHGFRKRTQRTPGGQITRARSLVRQYRD